MALEAPRVKASHVYGLYRQLPEPLRRSAVDFMNSLPGKDSEHYPEILDFIKGLYKEKVGINIDEEEEKIRVDNDMALEAAPVEASHVYELYQQLAEPLRQRVVNFNRSLPGRAAEHYPEILDFIKGLFKEKVGINLDEEEDLDEEI